jgi:hypothetical protein
MESLGKINQEEFSVAIPATLNLTLSAHLLRADKQEDVAFALYKPSKGQFRYTGLIYKIILPEDGDRDVHGNVDINPQYFKRVCRLAMEENSGVMLLHSHPSPGWQGMSSDDFKTERSYASTAETLTDHSFIGLTLGAPVYGSI